MIETLKNAFANKDIRKKILLTLLLLVVFRIGCYIPVPGIARGLLTEAVDVNSFLELMSGVTGGALANGTLFALGIGPYINASIIVQLLTVGIPALERLSKQGEEGRKKITNITRILTIVLAVIQAVGIIVNFAGGFSGMSDSSSISWALFFNQQWLAIIYMVVIYTAGAMLVMWLGERITEYGVGNGISLIIFVGIISTAGMTILSKLGSITADDLSALFEVIGFLVLAVVVFFCIVFVDLAERKIPVQYAKQVRGTKMYGGQSSVIPMKISGGGVMPLIFAFAIISFPSMIMSVVPAWSDALTWWNGVFGSGTWIYVIVLAVLIFAFSFFYAQIQFNPEDVSRTIQQNGGFIQGIRPGKPTAVYLRKINNRITLFGAIYLTLIAFIPSLIFSIATPDSNLINAFSTTGILIVVSVALEFDKQLQSQIMMKNYKGFLK